MIGEGLKVIEEEAFALCEELTVIYLPKSLQKIGEKAFFGCKKLEKVIFYDGIYSIGEKAFAECEKLEKNTLPATLLYLGNYAFGHCYGLKSVDFSGAVLKINIKTEPQKPEESDVQNSTSGYSILEEQPENPILQVGQIAFFECQNVTFYNMTVIKKKGKKVHVTKSTLKNALVYGWDDFFTKRKFN